MEVPELDIKNYLHEKEVEQLAGNDVAGIEFPRVKMSLNLPDDLNQRIHYMAAELDLKRSEFTRDLLSLALVEFEKHFGLDPQDFKKPYAHFIYSNMEDFKVGSIVITKSRFIEMIQSTRNKEAPSNE